MKKYFILLLMCVLLVSNNSYADEVNDIITNPGFINLLQNMDNTDIDYNGYASVIRSNKKNKKLIFGHSLAVTCYYATLDYDIVAVIGITIDGLKQILPYINKQYDEIYLWIGCNDLRYYKEAFFVSCNYLSLVHMIKMKFQSCIIKHLGEPKQRAGATHELLGNIFNDFLKNNYGSDFIVINDMADFDEYHFTTQKSLEIISRLN